MNGNTFFVPKILLCGDEAEFISRVGDKRPFKIVGHVQFCGEKYGQKFNFVQDGKILLNDRLCESSELLNMIRGGIDYIIFNDCREIAYLTNALNELGYPITQRITTLEFMSFPIDNFYDIWADAYLMGLLKNLLIKTLLDVDAHFVKGRLFTKEPNDLTEIDCIYDGDFFPMKENIFRHVYKDFSKCYLKHYDAVLLSEKSPADFDTAFYLLKDTTDLVITFARNDSSLIKHIQNSVNNFARVNFMPYSAGVWFFCYRRTPPTDFAMYVVTHKALPPELIENFPDKYKLIHAGRILGENLGYLGDNTGDNISELNPYLNEMTALYWIWKNTSHTVIGLSHYRRFFFQERPQNFLTEQEVLRILENYDIIVCKPFLSLGNSWHEQIAMAVRDEKLINFSEEVIRKNLMRKQPDYCNVFDYRMRMSGGYFKGMFVARRNVFDAYCEWLFSFMIDSTREVLRETELATTKGNLKRLMGFHCEGMLTVWLMKNRLRVKELNLIEIPGI